MTKEIEPLMSDTDRALLERICDNAEQGNVAAIQERMLLATMAANIAGPLAAKYEDNSYVTTRAVSMAKHILTKINGAPEK